jgi:hypothetical protein
VYPIPASRQAEVGTIVHDEAQTSISCPVGKPPGQLSRLVENARSVVNFVAILRESNAGCSQFLSRAE